MSIIEDHESLYNGCRDCKEYKDYGEWTGYTGRGIMSKGSTPRPVNRKKFNENYDRVFTEECSRCGECKSRGSFNKNKSKKNGIQSNCRECESLVGKERREKFPEKELERKRKWAQENKERCKKYQRGWADNNQDKIREYAKKYREENPIKIKARNKVSLAIKSGKLIPCPCGVCGEKAEAHHWSYKEEHWLDVVWLCRDHHKKLHCGRLYE